MEKDAAYHIPMMMMARLDLGNGAVLRPAAASAGFKVGGSINSWSLGNDAVLCPAAASASLLVGGGVNDGEDDEGIHLSYCEWCGRNFACDKVSEEHLQRLSEYLYLERLPKARRSRRAKEKQVF
ncbi:hypothetical protein FA15DRAFT_655461 [Coprinopsis marcescibilis]|uniref:Uncharacterized protein n=1 Tax=Coprinopsis marcescibilis TaxID=230819 RepID=A0A5C3KXN7_COPMA|nr:hypothetical protein FA15DRAFT_655461 [Coprinopsis marcescibilis]